MNGHPNSPRTPKNTTNGRNIKRTPAGTNAAAGKQQQHNRSPSLAEPKLTPITNGMRGNKKKGPTPQPQNGTPTGPMPVVDDAYISRQMDEVEVIKSIFADSVEVVQKQGAWNKPVIAVTIHLEAGDELIFLSLNLYIELTATYPTTSPIVELRDCKGLLPAERQSLEKTVQSILTIKGEEIIYEVASTVEQELKDIVSRQAEEKSKPSLLKDHQVQVQKAEEIAKELEMTKKAEARKKRLAEDTEIKAKVAMETAARREAHKENYNKPKLHEEEIEVSADDEYVSFDRSITIPAVSGAQPWIFTKVGGLVKIAQKDFAAVYTVRPVVKGKRKDDLCLVLKVFEIPVNDTDHIAAKHQVQDLELQLDQLRHVVHGNIVRLYESTVHHYGSSESGSKGHWKIFILQEHCLKGSLYDLLETVGSLDVNISKQWAIQMLEGLEHLHQQGFCHTGLHTGNILLTKNDDGHGTLIKIGDIGFTSQIQTLAHGNESSAVTGSSRSIFWFPPEISTKVVGKGDGKKRTAKTDIWNFGIIFLQMLFGPEIITKHESPASLIKSLGLSESLRFFLDDIFKTDPFERPRPFELMAYDFLRGNDPIIVSRDESPSSHRLSWSAPSQGRATRGRHNSIATIGGRFPGRYVNDFTEQGRLGKGGFGEVVKARNRIDGTSYAIKKIKKSHKTGLNKILSEVMLLSKLNHQYVVRYFAAWIEEEDFIGNMSEYAVDTDEESACDGELNVEFGTSSSASGQHHTYTHTRTTGGLDIVSTGHPEILFEAETDTDYAGNGAHSDDDDDDEDEDDEDDSDEDDEEDESDEEDSDDDSNAGSNVSPTHKPVKQGGRVTLYIQMELCEKRTLRDLMRSGLQTQPDTIWKLFRQILEGLAHIHGLGIIHRDLKPENVFIDKDGNPRIGDFGLATSGQVTRQKGPAQPETFANEGNNMTTDIGTALYVAPEVQANAKGKYNEKVDMYSIGIIFFEMCCAMGTAMERDKLVKELRSEAMKLPDEFNNDKAHEQQKSIILSLVNHEPSLRPSSKELLQSGKIPFAGEDLAIERAMASLLEQGTPLYKKAITTLFGQRNKEYIDLAYDAEQVPTTADAQLLRRTIQERLIAAFRRHGAVETHRPILIPRSSHYPTAMELMDSTGVLLQLPWDLILPHARMLARSGPIAPRTYSFGNVYRQTAAGAPNPHWEVNFDIMSSNSLDFALKEAEVIKMFAETIDCFPHYRPALTCFHINHAVLLDVILEYAHVPEHLWSVAKENLSKLHYLGVEWKHVKHDMRHAGIQPTSIDDLIKFDWRDDPETAFDRLRRLLEPAIKEDRLTSIFAHVMSVVTYAKGFNIHHRMYLNPLGTYFHHFYRSGVMFQCIFEGKGLTREVIGCGGRYDSLIQDYRPSDNTDKIHAVGFYLPLDRPFSGALKHIKSTTKQRSLKGEEDYSSWSTRRCDVLVGSMCGIALRSQCLSIVQQLWSNDVSAELASDAESTEVLMQQARANGVTWVVVVKVVGNEVVIKVRSVHERREQELTTTALVGFLKNEIQERERKVAHIERTRLAKQNAQIMDWAVDGQKSDVRTLLPDNKKGKKFSRNVITDDAMKKVNETAQFIANSPTLAIDLRLEVFEQIKKLTPKDQDGWKRLVSQVGLNEKGYVSQIRQAIEELANEGKKIVMLYNHKTADMAVIYL